MPIKQEDLIAASKRAEMIHSDNDLGQKMQAVVPQAAEAGPSNDELVENSHEENGASPVIDGDLHSPERANVNAIREAIETQAEMEVGKPIAETQEEVKAEAAGGSKSVSVPTSGGGAVTINITVASKKIAFVAHVPGHTNSKGEAAPWVIKQHNTGKILESFKSEGAANSGLKNMESHKGSGNRPSDMTPKVPTTAIGGEHQPGATAGHAGGTFGGTDLNAITPNLEKKGEVTATRPLTCYILDDMGDTEQAGHVNTTAEAAQWYKERGVNIYAEVEAKDDGENTTFVYKRMASWNYPAYKKAFTNKKTAAFLTIDEVKKAGQEYLHMIRTAAIRVTRGEDAGGFHILLDMNGREYVLRGTDADAFRKEYAAIGKPEAAVNKLVEKYLWKLQPYTKQTVPVAPGVHEKAQARDRAEGLADADAYHGGHEKQPNDYKRYYQYASQYEKTADEAALPAKRIKRINSHVGLSRYLGTLGDTGMEIPRIKEIPSPYAYSPTHTVYKTPEGKNVIIVETRHKTYDVFEVPATSPMSAQVQASAKKAAPIQEEKADYWGYDNWITGHTALMIDNTEVSSNTKLNLTRSALKKQQSAKELAVQFARFFKKQEKEGRDLYEENSADARSERGKFETDQLEGRKAEPTGDKAKDFVQGLTNLWYEHGGQSDWEQDAGSVDWEAIAEASMNEERIQNPDKYKETTKQDDKMLKGMGIKMESLKTAKKPMPQKGSPEWHQLKIAIKTLGMPDAMVGVMGGPDKATSRQIVAEYGINPAKYEGAPETNAPKLEPKIWPPQQASAKKAGEGQAKTPEEIEKEAGFNFFIPGQVLQEFQPDLLHEIVDYPNATNSPMQYPDIMGDKDALPSEVAIEAAVEASLNPTIVAYVSTSPAGGAGIGRDGKPQVLDGAPFRKDEEIRGPMFYDEFYQNQSVVPGSAFASKRKASDPVGDGHSKTNNRGAGQMFMEEYHAQYSGGPSMAAFSGKTAGADEAKQFALFLQKVTGEIAATFIAAFKVTSRPILDKVPGTGEIQLAQIEQPMGLSSFNLVNTQSRVKYVLDKLTDSEVQDAINDAFAQAAVWHDGGDGGFTYEVFVRIESIDTDSMIAKYKFVCGTKE